MRNYLAFTSLSQNSLIRYNGSGENNSNWKGDNVGNDGLHIWVKRWLPKPDLCQICDKKQPNELANITGIYNRDFINWQYLCYSCHRIFDMTEERRKNVSKARNGIKFSEEHKRKLRIASEKRRDPKTGRFY